VKTFFAVSAVLMMIWSVVAIVSPATVWYLQDGWKYKDVEPSENAMRATRFGGVFGIILGIVILSMLDRIFAGFPMSFP